MALELFDILRYPRLPVCLCAGTTLRALTLHQRTRTRMSEQPKVSKQHGTTLCQALCWDPSHLSHLPYTLHALPRSRLVEHRVALVDNAAQVFVHERHPETVHLQTCLHLKSIHSGCKTFSRQADDIQSG